MAFTFANRGLYTLLNSAVSGTTDLRQAVPNTPTGLSATE